MNLVSILTNLSKIIETYCIEDAEIQISTSRYYRGTVTLEADYDVLTDEQRINFKRIFDVPNRIPALKVKQNFSGDKDLVGERTFYFKEGDEEFALIVRGQLTRAYICTTLTPEEVQDLSENEKEKIWKHAEEGIVKFQNCTLATEVDKE